MMLVHLLFSGMGKIPIVSLSGVFPDEQSGCQGRRSYHCSDFPQARIHAVSNSVKVILACLAGAVFRRSIQPRKDRRGTRQAGSAYEPL